MTPWTATHQASLSITNSWSLLKFMSIELVMPSSHLILVPTVSHSCLPRRSSKTSRYLSSSMRTQKLQLTAEQQSTGESWIPPKKDTPHPRAEEKPQKDGRRGKIAFRINKPHTCQRCSKGSNKTLCAPGGPTETEPDLPLSI